MHRYESLVLSALKKRHEMSLEELMSGSGLGRDELLWAVENLSKMSYLDVEKLPVNEIELSQEGKKYSNDMLPEESLLERLRSKEAKASELSGEERIGLQWCLKLGLAIVESRIVRITAKGNASGLKTRDGAILRELAKNPDKYAELAKSDGASVKQLESRGLIKVREKSKIKKIIITPQGSSAKLSEDSGLLDTVTREVIANQAWKAAAFKRYDVSVAVEDEPVAVRHPLRRLINEIKGVYTSMGFTEISGPIVEPSFWVFDSLFVPQDHPAREVQDTFHISNPEFIPVNTDEYVRSVRKAHTKSWKSEWSREQSEKTVLSTQTTSVSVHYIHDFVKKLMEDGSELPQLPLKLFSVGRVFRNENIDFKHLADFYMTDGIIIGKNLTLANLFDTMATFYQNMGFKVRFKPAYFPFVEPGAEIFIYSDKLNTWIEVGGSGIMRTEVTSLQRKKVTVLAWGLGVERMLLLRDKSINGINELYNNGVGFLRSRKL